MARILVTEEIAERGLDLLRAAGHEVDVRIGLPADDYPGLGDAMLVCVTEMNSRDEIDSLVDELATLA